MRVDCEILHRLERGTNASEDVGPQRGVDCEISIDWGGERHRLERGMNASKNAGPEGGEGGRL